jgi:hypothetical protein
MPNNLSPCEREEAGGYHVIPGSCVQSSQHHLASSLHSQQTAPRCWGLSHPWAWCYFTSDSQAKKLVLIREIRVTNHHVLHCPNSWLLSSLWVCIRPSPSLPLFLILRPYTPRFSELIVHYFFQVPRIAQSQSIQDVISLLPTDSSWNQSIHQMWSQRSVSAVILRPWDLW